MPVPDISPDVLALNLGRKPPQTFAHLVLKLLEPLVKVQASGKYFRSPGCPCCFSLYESIPEDNHLAYTEDNILNKRKGAHLNSLDELKILVHIMCFIKCAHAQANA